MKKINRLGTVLDRKKVSSEKLASMVKRTPDAIERMCKNERQPTVRLLYEIADALKTDARELLIPTR